MPADSNAAAWIKARAPAWQALAAEAASAPKRSRATPDEALRTMQTYRTLARNLASARQLLPDSFLTTALEKAYATLHMAIGRPPRFGRARLLTLFRDDIPAAAASVRVTTLWIAALLVVSTFAGWWLVTTYPALVSIIASDRMIDGVEHRHLWTDQLFSVAPPGFLSARIFSNNVVVTLGAFCSGILFGLGTFYMISFNGLMLGGLLAFTHQFGLAHGLIRFILAHGPVELSVICLAGAAGTALGESLIRPRLASRAESLRRRSAELGPLLIACALLLFGSGLIEGFISPNPRFSIPFRLAVGLGYWTLMLLLLSGRLFPTKIFRTASMSSASSARLSSR
ncbi:MAG TPA: stage II sporulation protein M [Steroidobacteraceae bacterium]